ncbi:division/cell wall cluster transcriptional repressor MraZ [Spirochaeta lutea]|uniref:Transcriptional regulator MraZ n=1 Tax=Spirochaeta lutea TaxID=1480694 RepID=A0A098R152_9SPIO|nr:division/cell wall cluster transcriptional repressor MraZ [Spirochaeta lutea]KGE73506.1 cell division protein MraZ [Spirochaeta lutea]
MLTGEYRVSLDDKGRLIIPSRLRSAIPGDSLVLTRGVDRCLWLFPMEDWRALSSSLMEAASPFQKKARLLQRRIIAPAQEMDLDKLGRVNIPGTLQEAAGLQKDCVILGIEKYLEIWDLDEYQRYYAETEEEFQEAAEELGGLVSF